MNNQSGLEFAIENSEQQSRGLSTSISYYPNRSPNILLTISSDSTDQLVEIDVSMIDNTMYISDPGYHINQPNITDDKVLGNISRYDVAYVIDEYINDMELMTPEETDSLLNYILTDLWKKL